jgi:glycosyltransferase involved in cell wall biosynthesis
LRIAYFTDTFYPQVNGVTNTLNKLNIYLKKNNIEQMFFAPEYYTDTNVIPLDNIKRFKSVNLPFYPECRLSLPFYSKLSVAADKFKPDLIHIVTPIGIGLAGLKYAEERSIPIVSSYHTNFDVYLKYYKLELFKDVLWNFLKWFHNKCTINFCPSMDTKDILESKGINDVKIWARGIDPKIFNPMHRDYSLRKNLLKGNELLFLYVGRLALEKDLDILIESIKKINKIHPGKSRFIIAGDGPFAPFLRENAPDNVVFTGYLRGEELSTMYASCDAFVFPSSTETFGNVVLEAMASGLPVIAANSGGVKDNIKEGYTGILCESRNIESFTSAISNFIQNEILLKSMSANARQSILSKSWDRIFDQLIADYNHVLDEVKVIPHYSSIA